LQKVAHLFNKDYEFFGKNKRLSIIDHGVSSKQTPTSKTEQGKNKLLKKPESTKCGYSPFTESPFFRVVGRDWISLDHGPRISDMDVFASEPSKRLLFVAARLLSHG